MKRVSYTYSVIRYVHDAAVGECLNVGVVMLAPEATWLGAKFEERYRRLSETFRDFDGDGYRMTVDRFQSALGDVRKSAESMLPKVERGFVDVADLMRHVWPDQGLSFRIGPMLAGVTDDLDDALEHIFDRMVRSQSPAGPEQRRTNEEVWQVFRDPLETVHATRALREKEFKSQEFELTFKHAFKNHQWHVLQPVSFDYRTKESIQRTATLWLGRGVALENQRELGRIYFLLGAPRDGHRDAYGRAKSLLNKIEAPKELVEEDGADDFAKHLAKAMRRDGVEGFDEES